MTPRIAPSILSADFGRLREQVLDVVGAGAEVIHVDVMDGHFVPPITMGPVVVEALRELGVTLDVHLMVERPEQQIADFARAGAHNITIHAEATRHSSRVLQLIREHGCRAGLAINPGTPPAAYAEVDVDIALCMTVNPGWAGQAFIPTSLDKVRRVRALVDAGHRGPEGPGRTDVTVDGGIDAVTAAPCVEAGATLLVAGSAIFGSDDPASAYAAIAAAAVAA